MTLDRLVQMANQIDQFFASVGTQSEAVTGIAEHLKKFWSPLMRQMLIDAQDSPQAVGLSDRVRQALQLLSKH